MACGEGRICACVVDLAVCVCVECIWARPFAHTWSQLAVDEVPDKHAAAATRETIAHDPDTVGCSRS